MPRASRGGPHFGLEVLALGVATVGVAISKAIVASFVGHSYGQQIFGVFAGGTAVATTIAVVAELGVGEWVLYAYREGVRRPTGNAVRVVATASGGAAGLALFVFGTRAAASGAPWLPTLLPLTISYVAYAGEAIGQAVLRSRLQARRAAGLRALQVGMTAGTLALAGSMDWELVRLLWALAMMELLVLTTFVGGILLSGGRRDAARGAALSSERAPFLPFAVSTLAAYVYMSSDALLLTLLRGPSEVGDYTAAYRLYNVALQGTTLAVGAVVPVLYAETARARKRLLVSMARIQLAVAMIAAYVLGILAPVLITWYVGSEFRRSQLVLSFLAVSLFVKGVGAVPAAALTASGLQRLRTYAQVGTAGFNLVANLIAITAVGIWGAVVTTLVSDLLLVGAYAGFLAGFRKGWWRRVVSVKHVVPVAAMLVVAAEYAITGQAVVGAVLGGAIALASLRRIAWRHIRNVTDTFGAARARSLEE